MIVIFHPCDTVIPPLPRHDRHRLVSGPCTISCFVRISKRARTLDTVPNGQRCPLGLPAQTAGEAWDTHGRPKTGHWRCSSRPFRGSGAPKARTGLGEAELRVSISCHPDRSINAACDALLEREAAGKHEVRRETTAERRHRDDAATREVLRRSKGGCGNPECLLPELPYRTAAGKPLLEVDHIDNHASGGRGYPSAMIALCPNCHRNKTHGADRSRLPEQLRAEALKRHMALRGPGRD
ncbi:HNH endonuclease signature motif containing protein [[Kitasatospora] papulosa]